MPPVRADAPSFRLGSSIVMRELAGEDKKAKGSRVSYRGNRPQRQTRPTPTFQLAEDEKAVSHLDSASDIVLEQDNTTNPAVLSPPYYLALIATSTSLYSTACLQERYSEGCRCVHRDLFPAICVCCQ